MACIDLPGGSPVEAQEPSVSPVSVTAGLAATPTGVQGQDTDL